jgi:hypothetical protein
VVRASGIEKHNWDLASYTESTTACCWSESRRSRSPRPTAEFLLGQADRTPGPDEPIAITRRQLDCSAVSCSSVLSRPAIRAAAGQNQGDEVDVILLAGQHAVRWCRTRAGVFSPARRDERRADRGGGDRRERRAV